jgi:hypothetical protein
MRVSTPEAMKYITQQTNTKTTVPSYERATQKRPHPQTLIHSMRVAPKNEPRPRHGRPSHLLGQLTSKLRHNRIVHGSLALLLFCIPQFVQLAQRRVPHGPNHRLAGFGGHVLTVFRGGSGEGAGREPPRARWKWAVRTFGTIRFGRSEKRARRCWTLLWAMPY